MADHPMHKHPHLNSLTCFKYASKTSPPKNAHVSASIYLRYRTAETKPKNTYAVNEQANPQKTQTDEQESVSQQKQQQRQEITQKSVLQTATKHKWLLQLPANKEDKVEKSHRKNSTPKKIIDIYGLMKESSQKSSNKQSRVQKKQYENNKKLIEKLLSLRYKVKISSHPHLKQKATSKYQFSDTPKLQRERSEKIQAATEMKQLNLMIESLKSELAELNIEDREFKDMLSRKKRYDLQNNRPYSNQQIYDQIRSTYKLEIPEKNQEQYSHIHFKKEKSQTINIQSQNFKQIEGHPAIKYQTKQLFLKRRRAMVSQHELRNEGVRLQGW